jgi:hypothetical protein
MQWTQRASQRLDGGHDFGVQAVSTAVKVTEHDDFYQIVEGHRLFASHFADLPVKLPSDRHELFAQPFLLIVAARVKIQTVGRA